MLFVHLGQRWHAKKDCTKREGGTSAYLLEVGLKEVPWRGIKVVAGWYSLPLVGLALQVRTLALQLSNLSPQLMPLVHQATTQAGCECNALR